MKPIAEFARKSKFFRAAALILGCAGLALLPLAMIGCGHKGNAAEEEQKTPLVEVTTMHPLRKDLTRTVLQPGYLRPYEVTPIYAKIGGFALEPKHDIGDFVKEGQLLVELYVPEVEQDLKVKIARVTQAKADLKQAEESARAAKAGWEAASADASAKKAVIRSADAEVQRWFGEWERAKVLLMKGVYDQGTADQDKNQYLSSIARREEAQANYVSADAIVKKAEAYFHKAEADVLVAAASVDVAQSAKDSQKDWLDYRMITAPFDGIVTDRLVHKGHFLQPTNSGSTSKAAEPTFVMMRTDIMRCTVEVPELDAVLINDGDKAMVQLQAMPGTAIYGEVSRNTKSLDPKTRTLRVEVWLPNPVGATINYTASASGEITSVDPKPPTGGAGYPPNAVIPLRIARPGFAPVFTPPGKSKDSPKIPWRASTGKSKRAVVNATTNAAGEVVSYTLVENGTKYPAGNRTGNTIAEHMLQPNMYANVTIYARLPDAWTLPEDAIMNDILADGDRSYCFIVDEKGKVRKLFLEIGARCSDGIQILRKQRLDRKVWEPLTGHETVVITNNKALQDGQDVEVKAPETKVESAEK